ncbi:hypothetical protein FNV43_RR18389 [Rhamnella rubrinervis]|uniref:DUF630 domain-containing protein n=1 Tax=Rhamnella rubrinervis TaxID=2594499 RepID=A0A8K0GW48_9ROSA|nr:hypothetical protein FNV43_RR18389 [Rhamnella rubrinervis]
MGCTASKLDNEDTVRRCKERRRLMKEAVYARHHLAAAHADYCRSLRLTGSALESFSAFEPLSVSDQTPAVFLHPPQPPPISVNAIPTRANSTYSSTPSQASSIWNWENFYPPSPPDSEFFNQRTRSKQFHHEKQSNHDGMPHDDFDEGVETETERSEYDFFNPTAQKHNHLKEEFTETERGGAVQ